MPVNIRELVVSTSVRKSPAIQRVEKKEDAQSNAEEEKEEGTKDKDSKAKDVCASGDGAGGSGGANGEIVEEVLRQVMELLTEIGER